LLAKGFVVLGVNTGGVLGLATIPLFVKNGLDPEAERGFVIKGFVLPELVMNGLLSPAAGETNGLVVVAG
jgi:hypothetical protein